MENYIKVERKNIFKLGILDEEGNPKLDENGKELCLEFDLADVELPLKLNKCEHLIKKAQINFRNKVVIINKKQDKKGKMLLSSNEEEKIKALQEYYKDMEEAMDLFIGKGGTKKVFGNRRYWEMYEDLSEMLKPFLAKMRLDIDSMTDNIIKKYSQSSSNILKDE